MLVVRVELWSAISGRKTTLALMSIVNRGDSVNPRRGDYDVTTFKGRDEATLAQAMLDFHTKARLGASTRRGEVKNHARLGEHVWNLVAKALAAMSYRHE